MLADVVRWEGDVNYMYLDTHGLVTVGIGNLLASPAAAEELPFVRKDTGAPATKDEIAAAFHAVKAEQAGKHAKAYAPDTTLRLPGKVVRDLADQRLKAEFLPGLHRMFPGFEDFPAPARRALVDMAFNLGVSGLGRFHHLRTACEAGDWQAAAGECHRRSCRADRNEWTKDLFLEAAQTINPKV